MVTSSAAAHSRKLLTDAGLYDFYPNDCDATYDYSVNASLDAWTPPAKYSDLPELWTSFKYYEEMDLQSPGCPSVSKLTDWAKQMDGRCAVKPPVVRDTFIHYLTTSNVQDIRNSMMLETGVCTSFNNPTFVFFPIKDASDEVVPALYYFKHEPVGVPYLYHMRIADMPKRIHPRFLYCRFSLEAVSWGLKDKMCLPSRKHVPVSHPYRSKLKETLLGKREEEGPQKKKKKVNSGDGDFESQSEDSATTSTTSLPSNAFLYGSTDFKSPAEGLAVLTAREARISPSSREISEASEGFPNVVSEYEDSYPGMSDMVRLKLDYVRKNPSVISTTDPRTERYETDVFLSKSSVGP